MEHGVYFPLTGVTGITAPSLELPGQAFQSIRTLHPASVFTAVIAQHVKGVFATLISALFLSTSVPASDWWERSFGRHTIALIVQSISLLYVVEFPGFMCMVRNRKNRVFHFLYPLSVYSFCIHAGALRKGNTGRKVLASTAGCMLCSARQCTCTSHCTLDNCYGPTARCIPKLGQLAQHLRRKPI
jgi:hypothetical protein